MDSSSLLTILSIVSVVFSILFLVMFVFVYMWIVKLEKTGCECSKDWRRGFIKVYALIILVMVVLEIFFKLPDVVGIIYAVLSLVFIVVVFQYIHELKRIKCGCSESQTRDILEIVNYIQIGVVALFTLVIIFKFITTMINGGKVTKTKATSSKKSPTAKRY